MTLEEYIAKLELEALRNIAHRFSRETTKIEDWIINAKGKKAMEIVKTLREILAEERNKSEIHKAAYEALLDYFVVNWDSWPNSVNGKDWSFAIAKAIGARVQENLDPALNQVLANNNKKIAELTENLVSAQKELRKWQEDSWHGDGDCRDYIKQLKEVKDVK